MPKVDVYDINGKKVSDVELNENVFGIEPNEAIVHEVLVNYLANQRQGTQSTKTRAEVRADVFHLYDQKKQLKVISQRVGVQILYLLILSCVGYVLFYWQKPGSVNEGISGIQIFLLYFIAMFGTIWLWSICSVILCTLLRNMWAGIGCLFGIVIGLISKAGSSFFGNLGLFSFSFCEPTQLMSESWIYGTLVSFIAGLFLFAVLPMTLKKRG